MTTAAAAVDSATRPLHMITLLSPRRVRAATFVCACNMAPVLCARPAPTRPESRDPALRGAAVLFELLCAATTCTGMARQ